MSDASTNKPKDQLSKGSLIAGRYELVAELGRGGMSVVFHCVEAMLERDVAVKVFNFGEGEKDLFDRFQKEARAVSLLSHPNIVRVFASGVDGQKPYIVMELLKGRTLEELLKNGPLSPEQFHSIFAPVIEAVAHAHDQNIVHRDLKPANIMITEHGDTGSGAVKILDFSVAKFLNDNVAAAKTVGLAGTPYYMSPEQCAGAAVDARSDIYSLGCLMYECISGSKPFEGDTSFKIMYGHMNDPLPPFCEKGNSRLYSDALKEQVLKCLSKELAGRPQQAHLLKAALEEAGARSKGSLPSVLSGKAKGAIVGILFVVALLVVLFVVQMKMDRKPTLTASVMPLEVKSAHRMRTIKDRLRDNRALVVAGRFEEAAKEYPDIIKRCEATNKIELQAAYRDAAHCYLLLGRKDEAFALLRKRFLLPGEAPPGSERESEFTNELAYAYFETKDYASAIEICKKYISEHESPSSGKLNIFSTYDTVASFLIGANRSKEAIPYAKTCLTICDALPEGRSRTNAINSTRLYYMACSKSGVDMADAERELQKTMNIVGVFKGDEAAFRMVSVAKMLCDFERFDDGLHFLDEARKALGRLAPLKKAEAMKEIGDVAKAIEARRARKMTGVSTRARRNKGKDALRQ